MWLRPPPPLLSEEAGWHSSCYRNCLQNNRTKTVPCVGALFGNEQHFSSKILVSLPKEMNRLFGRYCFVLNVALLEWHLICFFSFYLHFHLLLWQKQRCTRLIKQLSHMPAILRFFLLCKRFLSTVFIAEDAIDIDDASILFSSRGFI